MNTAKTFLEAVGLITTAVSLLLFFISVISWFLGIGPLMYRLGLGRWRRKISVLADSEVYMSLKADLVNSGVFREKNITYITKRDLGKVKDCNLLLVNYGSFTAQEVKNIIKNKKSDAGMVVYFPDFSPTNRIPDDVVTLINNEPHTVLVNFRGRLINDVLVMLLSTSYERK